LLPNNDIEYSKVMSLRSNNNFINSSGFSVLNLIISIGLLAIVVFAVITQLNPIERAKESRDTRLRTDATTLQNAIKAFKQEESRLPWSDDFGGKEASPGLAWTSVRKPEVGVCGKDSCQQGGELVDRNKLDISFTNGSSVNAPDEDLLFLGKGKASNDKVFVCFYPESEKERSNFNELYSIDFELGISSRGAPLHCSDKVSWREGDKCYVCL
jgi:hypothetical protein